MASFLSVFTKRESVYQVVILEKLLAEILVHRLQLKKMIVWLLSNHADLRVPLRKVRRR